VPSAAEPAHSLKLSQLGEAQGRLRALLVGELAGIGQARRAESDAAAVPPRRMVARGGTQWRGIVIWPRAVRAPG
jgi:hypothetical protein